MTSRLDRLFLLLENGATVATRHAAAIQIGEVVKLHPHEFNNLLDRLHSYITSKSWETRIAASQALNAIISNLPHWDPMPIETAEESIQKDVSTSENVGHLTLESFNIRRVLENGSYLFAADESQFEIDDENSSIDPKDKAAHQRLLVNQRLGLDIADALGLSTQCLFTNADLSAQTTPTSQTNKEGKNSLVQIVQEELDQAGLKMSSRELNRAKRKAKILNKQKSNDPTDKSQHDTGERKRLKSVHRSSEAESIPGGLESADESEWPLLEYSDLLSRDLFSNSWEIRHGSATALREIIRQQGHNAGKRHRQTVQQIEDGHLSWLEDKAIRLVCVLALDRFGDFLSDQVVAPVRETSAQVLGCIALLLPNKTALSVMSLLQELLIWPHWGTRHGGLLGMKYLLAVRTDMRKDMLKKSFSFIYRGLQDETDDVVAVAATCLVPVAEDLLDCICPSTISDLVGTLWEALLEIDDLTASTNSILSLISKLLSYPVILNRFTEDLGQLISRLWPFLYHSNTTVRTSSLKALETLVRNLAEQRKNFCDDLTMPSLEDEDDSESKPAVTVGHTPVSQCTRTDQNVVPQIIKTEAPDQNQDKVPIKMELNEEEIKMEIHEEPIDYGDVVAETKQKLNISKESGEAKVALSWLEDVLESIMCHVFQRGLLECHPENRELIVKIWNLVIENASLSHLLVVSCRLVPSWLCLLMTAAKMPLDTNFLVLAYHSPKIAQGESPKKLRHACDLGERVGKIENAYYIGGSRDGLTAEEVEERVVMSRCIVARLIGHLSQYVCQPMPGIEYKPNDTPVLCYVRLLSSHLQSRSGVQRYCAGLVAREWAIMHPKTLCHTLLKTSLLNCLVETIYFDEITWMFTRLQQEVRDFVALMRHYKVEFDANFISKAVYTLEEIRDICEKTNYNSIKQRKNVAETLETRSKSILKNVSLTSTDQVKLAITVQSVIAGALLRFKSLPEKLNPVIKPLMESIKRETVPQHQLMAAQDLTFLMELCVDRQPSPNAKVVKNLAVFLCADESFTPNVIDSKSSDLHGEILAISLSTKPGAVGFVRRDSGSEPRRPGRPPKVNPSTSSEKLELSENPKEAEAKLQATIQRRGCTMSLTSIAKYFGQDLSTELPHFIELLFENLENPKPDLYFTSHLVERTQEIVNWLQLLEVIIPALHECYLQKFLPVLDSLTSWLYNSYSAVRHMSSRAFAVLANAESVTSPVVGYLIEEVLPKFERIDSDKHRMGALECLHLTIEKLGFNVIPYIVLLIIPLLGRMSDPIDVVRHLATQCFASLIRLYPLDGESNRLLRSVDPKLTLRIASERAFLDQLLDPRKIENYVIPVPIKAELRPYQQSGVNWMAFLNKFKLHGILCDDMGLGKTLQSICILAGDHYYKDKDNKNKVESPCKKGCQSLVICPPTLTGHWYYEVLRFVSREYLDPLHYTGPPVERKKLQCEFRNHNLIIASYKIVRNEIDFFSKIRWNYIILDEGHVIKNGKTKSSRAIKELIGQHRLILSGTPIQNNVLELWSLFDFLMPGFLGTERQFITKYSKPIIQSKEAKSSSKEQEAGVLALEALHRQVLPFLLRRVKEDVLQDLPPKITQDYYCDLSPLQERLYEDFTRSRNLADVNESDADSKNSPKDHVFQALQYLRRVCNHPKLVLTTSHPQYEAIVKHVKNTKISLDDIDQSAKLPALKQLLLDCGIGCAEENPSNVLNPSAVVAPHRALIFCQLKGMLDIIERDLLKMHLPTVSYLRLDGSVPAGDRHSLVQKFNSDPSIDLLLLTTHVGGLGLNLTGADTVIFVEHDWNPMRDLQAMDRAHRIGQKRVVNVYRLITKGTLEEKIMSLQKFKLMTANCVIGQENSSLLSMGTEQLLELFVLDTKKGNSSEISNSSNGSDTFGIQSPGFKKALEALPALWEENAYEEEYNIDTFLQKLR